MTRDESAIRADIEAARAKAQGLTDDDSVAAHKAAHEAVKALHQELADFLSAGAVPCAVCGNAPHGMLKTPAIGQALPVYEVGCTACGGAQRGDAPASAVTRWNKANG